MMNKAIVVTPEEYASAVEYARLMARFGIGFVVFLEHEAELAVRWNARVESDKG